MPKMKPKIKYTTNRQKASMYQKTEIHTTNRYLPFPYTAPYSGDERKKKEPLLLPKAQCM
jgi:hypothetical protein